MAAFNYQSLRWRMSRAETLERQDYRCQACGRDCRRERGRIVVHHALGARRYPAHAYDQRFLESLCTRCHDVVEVAIRYPIIAELIAIGLDPEKGLRVRQMFTPVAWQLPLDLEAANDEDFTLDPPIEVPAD